MKRNNEEQFELEILQLLLQFSFIYFFKIKITVFPTVTNIIY